MSNAWNRFIYGLWSPVYRAQKKIPIPGLSVDLKVGDAQELPFEKGAFDVVILNLILSVVPDAKRCMVEALRILHPEGRIVVFDKFLPDATSPSQIRMLANAISTLLGTNINRRLGDRIASQPCVVTHDEPSILGGMYRVITLTKATEDTIGGD